MRPFKQDRLRQVEPHSLPEKIIRERISSKALKPAFNTADTFSGFRRVAANGQTKRPGSKQCQGTSPRLGRKVGFCKGIPAFMSSKGSSLMRM